MEKLVSANEYGKAIQIANEQLSEMLKHRQMLKSLMGPPKMMKRKSTILVSEGFDSYSNTNIDDLDDDKQRASTADLHFCVGNRKFLIEDINKSDLMPSFELTYEEMTVDDEQNKSDSPNV